MERVLMMRLRSQNCAAEVQINGIAVGRVGAAGGSLCLPVHEYLLAGDNAFQLVIDPPQVGIIKMGAVSRIAEDAVSAGMRLLLPRLGQPGSELHARTLASMDWSVAEGDLYETPHTERCTASLPIKFPKWRWLDVPEIKDPESLKPLVMRYLQGIAIGLARGDVEVFLAASRIRLEDLALAYQQSLADVSGRFRARLQLLHATKAMKMVIPNLDDLTLRLCAHGRLLECLGPQGEPALRTLTAPDGTRTSWPVRVAVVNGECHILR